MGAEGTEHRARPVRHQRHLGRERFGAARAAGVHRAMIGDDEERRGGIKLAEQAADVLRGLLECMHVRATRVEAGRSARAVRLHVRLRELRRQQLEQVAVDAGRGRGRDGGHPMARLLVLQPPFLFIELQGMEHAASGCGRARPRRPRTTVTAAATRAAATRCPAARSGTGATRAAHTGPARAPSPGSGRLVVRGGKGTVEELHARLVGLAARDETVPVDLLVRGLLGPSRPRTELWGDGALGKEAVRPEQLAVEELRKPRATRRKRGEAVQARLPEDRVKGRLWQPMVAVDASECRRGARCEGEPLGR